MKIRKQMAVAAIVIVRVVWCTMCAIQAYKNLVTGEVLIGIQWAVLTAYLVFVGIRDYLEEVHDVG